MRGQHCFLYFCRSGGVPCWLASRPLSLSIWRQLHLQSFGFWRQLVAEHRTLCRDAEHVVEFVEMHLMVSTKLADCAVTLTRTPPNALSMHSYLHSWIIVTSFMVYQRHPQLPSNASKAVQLANSPSKTPTTHQSSPSTSSLASH